MLLVYDVTNRASFESLSQWMVEMKENLTKPSEMDSIIFAVCANKARQIMLRSSCLDGGNWNDFRWHEAKLEESESPTFTENRTWTPAMCATVPPVQWLRGLVVVRLPMTQCWELRPGVMGLIHGDCRLFTLLYFSVLASQHLNQDK